MEKHSKVAIIIPAFNEAEAIAGVVAGTSVFGTTIVVNDGSSDNTGHNARSAGAFVIDHEINRGYDNALASGLSKALEQKFDYAIIVDGDGQHDLERIEVFMDELLRGADLVVGTRDRFQRISETIFARLAHMLWGIADPLCGMKGYRLSKLKDAGSLCSYNSIGTELLIRAARSRWNIRQVPVRTRNRSGKSRFGVGLYPNLLIVRAMLWGLLKAKAQTHESEVGI